MKKNKPLGYYPGCSGLGTSVEYDKSTRIVAVALNVKLEDIKDWNCCGSTPTHTIDHGLSTALSARNFVQAEKQGLNDVVTPCPSCLKNLRTSLHRMKDPHVGPQAEKLLGNTLKEEHTVKSILQVIHEDIDRDFLKSHVSRPLMGLKVVPYYGCLMSRPAELMQFGDPENPMAMDDILEAAGATVLPFPLKVECCGASMGIPLNEAVTRLSGKIVNLAASLGADVIAVACPLCQMNLDMRQGQIEKANDTKYNLPVMYYTQLLGLAFGLPEKELGLSKLVVNPKPVLDKLAANENKAEGAA
jgi:heterodisulfide reductase subunit B